MSETYEITRRIISRGTFKTMCAERFRPSGGTPIYRGDARIGYLTAQVPFETADSRLGITFGPNRAFAPSAHYLKRANGDLIAQIRHGLVQFAWGGKRFKVSDASGVPLFDLVPGEILKSGSNQLIGAPLSGELYAVRGAEILGHTGGETQAVNSEGGMAGATSRTGRILTRLPGLLADRFKEEILGKSVEREEAIVARFTLLTSAGLEPHVIFAILMFKLHYHTMRGF